MIPLFFWLGGILFVLVWLAGLPALWSGRPSLSLFGAAGGIVVGLISAIGAMTAPRYSDFWLGGAGQGDGFGLIGLIVFSASLAFASFIALSVTAMIASVRGKNTDKEASE